MDRGDYLRKLINDPKSLLNNARVFGSSSRSERLLLQHKFAVTNTKAGMVAWAHRDGSRQRSIPSAPVGGADQDRTSTTCGFRHNARRIAVTWITSGDGADEFASRRYSPTRHAEPGRFPDPVSVFPFTCPAGPTFASFAGTAQG
jgi:hypothetical protein